MSKSLFEFSRNKKNVVEPVREKSSKCRNIDENDVKKKIKEYSKFSENDLMKELYKEVGKQKAGGNFDINNLSKQLDNVKPMLNQKQNENLERILKNLK